MRDLGDADVEIGQHRLRGLDVVIGEFWRTHLRCGPLPSRSQARPASRNAPLPGRNLAGRPTTGASTASPVAAGPVNMH
jgi:hypothetical protein